MKKAKTFCSLALALFALLASVAPAGAALPADRSWVKYSGNPVGPAGLCGLTVNPFRPAILVEAANAYKMYFDDANDGGTIYLATTADGGQTWTCTGPVLTVGGLGAWDEASAGNPTVIKDGATYKMWYAGRNSSGVYAIGYATSLDGVNWDKHPGNPVMALGSLPAWDSQTVREPSVVKAGGTFHLWYAGASSSLAFQIGHATSPDGLAWTRDPANPVLTGTANAWDATSVYAPSVVYDGVSFEMFYSGLGANRWLTGHAASADGAAWTKDDNAIVAPSDSGWDDGVATDYAGAALDGATWKLFYSGRGAGGGYQIGLATLADQAQLTFDDLATSVQVGHNVVVTLDISAVTGLYGYQFEVNYDPDTVSATGAFVNTFFNTTINTFVPGGWNGACAAGVCRFAASKVSPGTASSGSGPLAQITFTGLAAGTIPLTYSDTLLSDIDGAQLEHTLATGWLAVQNVPTASTLVSFRARPAPAAGAIWLAGGLLAAGLAAALGGAIGRRWPPGAAGRKGGAVGPNSNR